MHKRRGMRKTQWTTTGNWAIKEHLFYLKIHKITFFYKKKVQKLLNAPKRFWIEICFFFSLSRKIDKEEEKNIATTDQAQLWCENCNERFRASVITGMRHTTISMKSNHTHYKCIFFYFFFLSAVNAHIIQIPYTHPVCTVHHIHVM